VPEDQRDYFLKIDGIEGESQDQSHRGEIRLHDFNLAMTNRGNRAGYSVGRPYFEDATFSGPIDASYTKLNEACLKNVAVPKVVLTCRKAGKTQYDFLVITFTKVYVTNCRIDTLAESPKMEFTLGFARLQVDYREQKQEGGLGGALSAVFELASGRTEAGS
jgi:type VI secretion system secreted protein Hcp